MLAVDHASRSSSRSTVPVLVAIAIGAVALGTAALGVTARPLRAQGAPGGQSAAGAVSTPGAPGAPGARTPAGNNAADVAFMQGMIHHHAQALQMVAMIPSRTTRQDMRYLAQRIAISQRDEIALMSRWLAAHHEEVPRVDTVYDASGAGASTAARSGGETGGGGGGAMAGMPGMAGMAGGLMPGMLTAEQMAALARATGPEFERLLLQGMIGHHEGALTMVANLLHTSGAAQAPEVFQFAADVDADQRAEIKRMQGMLAATPDQTHH